MEEILKQIDVKKRIFKWLIDGMFIHCLPISAVSYLTPERICELYNVELDYFYGKNNEFKPCV